MPKLIFEFENDREYTAIEFEAFVSNEPSLRRTDKVMVVNPATGDLIAHTSPPHILADVLDHDNNVVGFIGFTKTHDGTMSIGCEGDGTCFLEMVSRFEKSAEVVRREPN